MWIKKALQCINFSQYATLGVGAILVTMTFITIPLMDRLGRRVLHLTGLAGIVVCSICITVALTLQASDKDNQSLGVFLIAVTLIFVAFFAFGPGSIPWMAAGTYIHNTQLQMHKGYLFYLSQLNSLDYGHLLVRASTLDVYGFHPDS